MYFYYNGSNMPEAHFNEAVFAKLPLKAFLFKMGNSVKNE